MSDMAGIDYRKLEKVVKHQPTEFYLQVIQTICLVILTAVLFFRIF